MNTLERVSRVVITSLIRKELHQYRWILIVGFLFGAGIAAILVMTFYYLEQVITEVPDDLLQLLSEFAVTRELLFLFGDYTIYVWSQWNAKNLLQAGALLAIILSASQFAGEVSRRTMSFYLTRPASRTEAFSAKVLAGSIIMLLIFAGSTVLIWIASVFSGYEADWGSIVGALSISLAWLNVYYLIGSIISTFSREPVTAGVIIGLSGVVLSLPGLFTGARSWSIFYQMRAVDYFLYNQPYFPYLAAALLLNLVLFLVGTRIFKNKDF